MITEKLILNGEEIEFKAKRVSDEKYIVELEGREYEVSKNLDRLQLNGISSLVTSYSAPTESYYQVNDHQVVIENASRKKRIGGAMGGAYQSPMPGKVLKVMVSSGEKVDQGQVLMVIEAMKMEHSIKAQSSGTIKEIHFKEGEQVAAKVELLEVED